MHPRIVALAAAVALAAVAGPSMAAPPEAADRAAFDGLVEQARAAREAGRLEEALDALQRAYAISDSAAVLNNIAVLLGALGRYDAAHAAARRLADHPDVPPDKRAAVVAQRDAFAAKAGRAWLVVRANPGATVRVGGAALAQDVEHALAEGVHPVTASGLAEGASARLTVDARRGERAVLDLGGSALGDTLGALDAAAIEDPSLTIDGEPWRPGVGDAGTTMWLPPGSYAVAIAGGPPRRVTVTAGRVTPLVTTASVADGPGAAPWILAGVGAAGVVAGIALAVDADVRRDDLSARLATSGAPIDAIGRAAALDEEAAADTEAAAGAVAMGLGGALLAGGILWLLLDDPQPGAPRVDVLPTLTPSPAGASAGVEVRW